MKLAKENKILKEKGKQLQGLKAMNTNGLKPYSTVCILGGKGHSQGSSRVILIGNPLFWTFFKILSITDHIINSCR